MDDVLQFVLRVKIGRPVELDKNLLPDAFESLPERWRDIIRMRIAEMTLAEIGEKLGISAERVRQIQAKAVRRLVAAMTVRK